MKKLADCVPTFDAATVETADAKRQAEVERVAMLVLEGANDEHQGVPELRRLRRLRRLRNASGQWVETTAAHHAYLTGRAVVDCILDVRRDVIPILGHVTRKRSTLKKPDAYFVKCLYGAIKQKRGGNEWLKKHQAISAAIAKRNQRQDDTEVA